MNSMIPMAVSTVELSTCYPSLLFLLCWLHSCAEGPTVVGIMHTQSKSMLQISDDNLSRQGSAKRY